MWKLFIVGLLVTAAWTDAANAGLINAFGAAQSGLDDNPPIALHSPSESTITLSNLNGVSRVDIMLARKLSQPPSASLPVTEEDWRVLFEEIWRFERINSWTWSSGEGQTFSEPFVIGPFEALSAVPASMTFYYRKLSVTAYYQIGSVITTAEPTSAALLPSGLVAISILRRRRAGVRP